MKTLIKDDYLTYLEILEGAKFHVFFTRKGDLVKKARSVKNDVREDKITYTEDMFAELIHRFYSNKMNDDFLMILDVLFQSEVNFYFNLYLSKKLQKKNGDNDRIKEISTEIVETNKLPEFLAIRFINVMSLTKAEHLEVPVDKFEGFISYALCNLKLDPSFLKFVEKIKKMFFSAVMNYVQWADISVGQLSRDELSKKIENARKGYEYLSSNRLTTRVYS